MKVVLVNMPFAGIRPAIGISLLQARLRDDGVDVSSVYLNMRFAQRLGVGNYEKIADRSPIPALAGDWIFASSAFGERPDADRSYLDSYAERFGCSPADAALVRHARTAAAPFLDDALTAVDWSACDMVGFTSTFSQNLASVALAQRIKQRHPGIVVVFGGANCEGEMGLALLRNFPCIDYVCCGEADATFPALVDALRRDAVDPPAIRGVAYRRDGEATIERLTADPTRNLDALPVPDYDDYFTELDGWPPPTESRKTVLMESSRGCWWGEKHHCTFCGLNGSTMAFRSKSAERVLTELLALRERYHPYAVEMVDNILDMQYFRDLIPSLRDLDLDLSLFFEVKANLTKDQVRMMRAAGIRTIQPGIESFSNDVLTRMRKGTTAMQNIQLLKWCKEIGVEAYWNLLYGFPGEDPADYDAMAELMGSLCHLQPPHAVGAVRLDRFSPYFNESAALGVENVRADRSYPLVYDLPPAELDALAYYFEFDYADGRDPHSYADGIRHAVRWWHEHALSGSLVSADHGTMLALWDRRPRAARMVTILTGAERDAYLYCDQHRSRTGVEALLAERGWDAVRIGTFLDGLTRDRLLLQHDGRLLALAIPTPTRRDEQEVARQPLEMPGHETPVTSSRS